MVCILRFLNRGDSPKPSEFAFAKIEGWKKECAVGALHASTNSSWEDQVAAVVVSDLEESEKARPLLQLFPTLPEAGQEQVARHLSTTLTDEEYPLLALYLTDASLPDPVQDALLEGLLIRADSIKAPLLLTIAADEEHPKAQEARTLLEALLGREMGEDSSSWATIVRRWLEAQQQ